MPDAAEADLYLGGMVKVDGPHAPATVRRRPCADDRAPTTVRRRPCADVSLLVVDTASVAACHPKNPTPLPGLPCPSIRPGHTKTGRPRMISAW